MDNPRVFDQNGQQQDWDWFVANFGPISVERAPATSGKVYRITKLRESIGPAVLIGSVRDADGLPMISTTVVRYWPDAPELPPFGDPASRWLPRGVTGPTNEEGNVGFGMGHGDYYFPPNIGASAMWVADQRGPSDLVRGLGMLGGTDHRHFDIFFQLTDVGAPEPPEPPEPGTKPVTEDQWKILVDKLDKIIALLEK